MTNPKKYRLLKTYESPLGRVHAGVAETIQEWQRMWFPKLTDEDFDIKNDWFEEVTDTPVKGDLGKMKIAGIQFYDETGMRSGFLHFEESKQSAIKKAIEEVLNPPASTPAPEDKGWQIIEFRGMYLGHSCISFLCCDDGIYRTSLNGKVYTEPVEKLIKVMNIYSVKRTSDNTVWCVGGETLYGKIKMFQVSSSGDLNVFFYTDGICRSIHDLQKLPSKPLPVKLFTTEDGVELFDRSIEVWGVDKNTLKIVTGNGNSIGTWINGWYTVDKIPNPTDNDQNVLKELKERFCIFSTEQAANEYILLNKPCLSVKDILALWVISGEARASLIKLAQSKQSK